MQQLDTYIFDKKDLIIKGLEMDISQDTEKQMALAMIQHQINSQFSKYDKGTKGYLSLSEYTKMLNHLFATFSNQEQKTTFTEEQISMLVGFTIHNSSGRITKQDSKKIVKALMFPQMKNKQSRYVNYSIAQLCQMGDEELDQEKAQEEYQNLISEPQKEMKNQKKSDKIRQLSEQQIRVLADFFFQKYDKDFSGTLDIDEMVELYNEMTVKKNGKPESKENIYAGLKQGFPNYNGYLNKQQFLQFMIKVLGEDSNEQETNPQNKIKNDPKQSNDFGFQNSNFTNYGSQQQTPNYGGQRPQQNQNPGKNNEKLQYIQMMLNREWPKYDLYQTGKISITNFIQITQTICSLVQQSQRVPFTKSQVSAFLRNTMNNYSKQISMEESLNLYQKKIALLEKQKSNSGINAPQKNIQPVGSSQKPPVQQQFGNVAPVSSGKPANGQMTKQMLQQTINRCWEKFDLSYSGKLDVASFTQMLNDLSKIITPTETRVLTTKQVSASLSRYLKNFSGFISRAQAMDLFVNKIFASKLSKPKNDGSKQTMMNPVSIQQFGPSLNQQNKMFLSFFFEQYDTNSSGTLDLDQLMQMNESTRGGNKQTKDRLQAYIRSQIPNFDGYMTREQFNKIMQKKKNIGTQQTLNYGQQPINYGYTQQFTQGSYSSLTPQQQNYQSYNYAQEQSQNFQSNSFYGGSSQPQSQFSWQYNQTGNPYQATGVQNFAKGNQANFGYNMGGNQARQPNQSTNTNMNNFQSMMTTPYKF